MTPRLLKRDFDHLATLALRGLALGIAAALAIPAHAFALSFVGQGEDHAQFRVTAGASSFSTVTELAPTIGIPRNGHGQSATARMTNFTVKDASGAGAGWEVTVNADASPDHTRAPLTLNSAGASFRPVHGTTEAPPSLACQSGCILDSVSPVKIAFAPFGAGMGTWLASGWTAVSVALRSRNTPAALRRSEAYRVALVWTFSFGP